MERPTCETCPHWNLESHNGTAAECVRFPPQFVGEPDDEKDFDGGYYWAHPWTYEADSCGEHPDFPAYAESLRTRARDKDQG